MHCVVYNLFLSFGLGEKASSISVFWVFEEREAHSIAFSC